MHRAISPRRRKSYVAWHKVQAELSSDELLHGFVIVTAANCTLNSPSLNSQCIIVVTRQGKEVVKLKCEVGDGREFEPHHGYRIRPPLNLGNSLRLVRTNRRCYYRILRFSFLRYFVCPLLPSFHFQFYNGVCPSSINRHLEKDSE
jgi:hypothetical protein